MRILVATDAWKPQVNGVVNTYVNLEREARGAGFSLSFMTPAEFNTVPLPGYSEIRLALAWASDAARIVERERPDCIHIATEGSIGFAMRAYCIRNRLHHELSHPLSGIRRSPLPPAAFLELRDGALVSQCRLRRDGGNALALRRA